MDISMPSEICFSFTRLRAHELCLAIASITPIIFRSSRGCALSWCKADREPGETTMTQTAIAKQDPSGLMLMLISMAQTTTLGLSTMQRVDLTLLDTAH